MRGIQVDAVRFRQIRRARGFTQQQLAKLAGVGERTVRNAETGQRVRLDFLRFLATVLGISVADVVHDDDELRTALREEDRVANLTAAMEVLVLHHDISEYTSLAGKSVLVNMIGPAEIPLCGEFRGLGGLQRLQELNEQHLSHDQPPESLEIRASGNFVIFSGRDSMQVVSTGKTFSTPMQHIYEFENGHFVRAEVWADTAAMAEAFRPG